MGPTMYINLFGNSNPTYIMLYPMPKASSMIYDDRYPRVCTTWILRFQSNDRFWKIVHDDLPVVVIPVTIIRVTHDQFQEGIEMKYITSIGKYCNCNVHTTNRWGKKNEKKTLPKKLGHLCLAALQVQSHLYIYLELKTTRKITEAQPFSIIFAFLPSLISLSFVRSMFEHWSKKKT